MGFAIAAKLVRHQNVAPRCSLHLYLPESSEAIMKPISILTFFLAVTTSLAAAQTQAFPTSAGPVRITPLNHASTLIEAGGKTIYLDPAKPAKLDGLPKADLILITDIHGDHRDFRAAGCRPDCHHRQADRQR
jgi:hypothetical protein